MLWARADTYDALVSAFVAFAELLQLPQREEKDQLKVVQAVKDWLKTHDRWLLILDNADDLALVKDFLPPAGAGHTLLTTRATSMGRLAGRIEVDTLAQEVGALFLLRRAGLLAPDADLQQAAVGDRAAALEITRELGGLPLALDQAGAYIEKMQCSLPDYLQLYRAHRADLLKERGGLVPDHPEPVATTWSLSFTKIEQFNPAAADLLRLCAFLHPDAIPEEIITGGAEHPQVAYPLNGLANLYSEQGKYAEAEPLYQQALHIWEQAYGPGHPYTRTAMKNYAILLRNMKRETEALSLEARFPSSS